MGSQHLEQSELLGLIFKLFLNKLCKISKALLSMSFFS
jgi:hypothetical protein